MFGDSVGIKVTHDIGGTSTQRKASCKTILLSPMLFNIVADMLAVIINMPMLMVRLRD
jgi:hypothetical protein